MRAREVVGVGVWVWVCFSTGVGVGGCGWRVGGVWVACVGGRGQVAGSLPGRQPGTGTRTVREGALTPSLHPEVPGNEFASPGRGLDIRKCAGVCGTARSGIWVLKGNARTCMFPANVDCFRVEWMKQGAYKTAWVAPGHGCL